MADYYVDDNGNVTKKKKKKKQSDYIVSDSGKVTKVEEKKETTKSKDKSITYKDNGKTYNIPTATQLIKEKYLSDDIAPVKDDRTWFQKGALKDGFSFKNLGKAIGGTITDARENISSGILGMGEKVVDALAWASPYIAQGQYNESGANLVQNKEIQKQNKEFFDKAKEENAKFIAKDLYNEEQIAKKIISDPVKRFTGIDAEKHSVFGEKTDSLIQSAGQLGAQVGLQAVGVPWFVTSGVTAFGGETENALKQGASMEEAGLSGAITAGAEILTEKISGGISFGGKTLDSALTKQLASKISDKFWRTTAKLGLDAFGEGAEEWISEDISKFGQWLTYQDEKTLSEMLWSEEAMDEKIEAFISGGVLGGGSGSVNIVKSKINGVDYVSGLTKNEQSVVDKEVENRINEKKGNGENVNRSKIYDDVMRDLEKGYISTDTIEEVLGGDSYKAYKDTTDNETNQETALNEQIKALEDEINTSTDNTTEQRQKLSEARKLLENLKSNSKIGELRKTLSETVYGLAKDSKLVESYNEIARRGQTFDADMSKYTEKEQAVVQKAIDSGILNNSNRTHEFVDMVAKISADKGVFFDFANNTKLKESGFAKEGVTINGFVTKDGITLNIDSAKALNKVTGHEISHVLEGTELYNAFQQTMFDYAKSKGDFDSRYEALKELYKDVEGANIEAELTADLVGDYLFTDADFINHLSTKNRNVFQKVYDEIKYLCKVATAGSKEARELEKVKKAFAKAYKENGNTKADTQYSLSTSDKNITDYSTGYAYGETYFTMSYTQDGKVVGTLEYGVYEGEPNIKMVEVSPEYRRKGIGTKLLQELQKKYPDTEINFGMSTPDGTKLLENATYTVENTEVAGKLARIDELKSKLDEYDKGYEHYFENDLDIPENYAEDYNELYDEMRNLQKEVRGKKPTKTFVKTDTGTKYSLTAEQEEFFKDSKVRDEDGNLKVMYHGTSKGGHTVFDTFGESRFGLFGAGTYFTDSKNIAESYTDKGRGNTPQVYEAYLNIKNPMDMDAVGDYEAWKKAFPDARFIEGDTNEQFFRSMVANFRYEEYPVWEAKDTAMSVIESMGYDGITHMGGGRINPDGERHRVYIAFYPEQIKNIDNTKPTDNPDIRYSLSSDSEGRKLSENQSKYFEESKAIDDNGNLKVVYHGTRNADFTVFKRNINFFTDSKEMADSYSPNGEMYEGYLNIKKPFEIDAQGEKWSRIPIDDETKKFLQEYGAGVFKENGKWCTTPADIASAIEEAVDNGDMDYDGIIIKNIDDTGSYYKGEEKHIATDYIVFNSNQFKNATNQNPTDNPDIRYSLSKTDSEYLSAVERGDMETAQQMVIDVAKKAGYINDTSWKMQHSAPNSKDDVSLYKLKASGLVPDDYWTHPQWYQTSPEERESFWKVKEAIELQERREEKGNLKDATMWVYRAVDKTVNTKEDFFRNGDWVTPSHDYAVNEGRMNPNGYRIIKQRVSIKDLYWDGNSIAELGYDDGKNYAYADTTNNRKLLDPVTYDDNGNVIPLSKRFKKRNWDTRYSLSKEGEIAPTSRNDIYGKDIKLETATEDIAPSQETVSPDLPIADIPSEPSLYDLIREKEELEQRSYEEAKRATETGNTEAYLQLAERHRVLTEQIEAMQKDQKEAFYSISDEDAPPEMEAPYYAEDVESNIPTDPIDDRNLDDVGNRKIKAYQYEHPEVKPFFRQYAEYMLNDLRNSVKGERFYDDELYWNTNGEKGWTGVKRQTTPEIEALLDNYHYTYAEIEKGIKAIIEDNGAENNACSKRIEIFLHDWLMNGYEQEGYQVPPNQDYINLLNAQQIDEYYKSEFNSYLDSMGDSAVLSEIAPTIENEVAPVEQTETVKPKAKKNVNAEEQTTAEILTEKPTTEQQKKRGLWSYIKEGVFDKGMVFETLSKKTKNRELEARWDTVRRAEGMAQRFMQKGKDEVMSLDSIRKEVEGTGKTKEFYEYLYHNLNIDRMTLEDRYEDVKNKAVFGYSVTADMSQEIASQIEAKNPEFKSYAKDVYAYMNYLRKLMVDNGVISKETANLWSEMYPHYVPIHRLGDSGLDINVPLDTGRTGVNAPVKGATGGNRDILPLFDTMAQRTIQTYKAVAKNRFGVELKNTLGTTIAKDSTNLDDVIDSIDAQDDLLKEGKNGRKPTFTVFENGERVEFEITEEMYDALKPTSEKMAYTNKVASVVSNVHKGLLTEYNPVFLATNSVKDVQDILLNSQHPARTYAELPEAYKELATKGKWYTEYMENGGEQNTYFDSKKDSFAKEKAGIKKIVGMPLDTIATANNFVEMAPRLAEYIASRKVGRSIDVSMLDASRVTTNFKAGGDLTKFLNRNGATFLNASVQGAVQQARNIQEAKMNGLKGWVGLATRFAIAGLSSLALNKLLWDDDEEYEELSDYIKQNYYIVAKYGDGQFVRIPKGRAVAVIQNAFEQISNVATGNDEADLKSFLKLAISNLAPNNPFDNNIIAPIIQAKTNTTWYEGDLVPSRLQDLPKEEQFDETTDAISKWLGETFNDSPYKINYVLNQYSGGLGDVVLPMLTPKAERGDNSTKGKLIAPFKDKFTTDGVLKNQNVSDFYSKVEELTVNANSIKATDEDILKSKYINSINTELGELYKQKREIQNSDLSDSEKYSAVRDIQEQINSIAKESLNTYNDVNIDGVYATVGDLHYRTNKDGEWEKITDKQLEKQEEVTSGLGITPSDYWGNKEEYDYAYEYPGKYAISKAVGGYETYKSYSSELYDIKADKDENGKSISGSRKEKVIEYIDSLDIEYGEKIILYKSEYNADDSLNYEIIEYLDSRDDISYDDAMTILEEIGFTVNRSNGNISWD